MPDRSGRAIAGLSMGGFGALSYAARSPGAFGAVGSFSGGTDIDALAVDPTHQDAREVVDSALVTFGASIVFQGVIGFDAMDDRLPGTTIDARLGEVVGPPSQWPAFNPQDLAEAGAYAPFDGAMAVYTGNEGTDCELGGWNTTLHQALAADGVDHVSARAPASTTGSTGGGTCSAS